MRAVDTNVLVRLIARDDRKQVEAAEEFISKGAWISCLVLAETSWVLESKFKLDAQQVASAVEMLLNHAQFTIQDADAVQTALENFRKRPAVDFSDNLIVEIARKNGHLPVGTFDREMSKLGGTQRLG
jgi:predicted nucleic-acid-binding protein